MADPETDPTAVEEEADDGYNSAEDDDYVPSDESGCEEEFMPDAADDDEAAGSGKKLADGSVVKGKRKRKASTANGAERKIKRGCFAANGDDAGEEKKAAGGEEEGGETALERVTRTAAERKAADEAAAKKARIDAMWARMNSKKKGKKGAPVSAPAGAAGGKTNTTAAAARTANSMRVVGGVSKAKVKEFVMPSVGAKGTATAAKPGMVKVKQTYDFAGETVEVEKEVAADSKEGKKALKSTGLDGLVSALTSKKKMNVITKSRLDWESFKKTEDLEEELAYTTKDGFLEKQAFLQRSDLREYEKEKEVRDKHRKQRERLAKRPPK